MYVIKGCQNDNSVITEVENCTSERIAKLLVKALTANNPENEISTEYWYEKVPDNDVAKLWLQNFMKEVNTQNNRITATPYFYTLRCPTRVVGTADDYSDGHAWVNSDSEEITDIQEYVLDCWEDEGEEGPLHKEMAAFKDTFKLTSKEDVDEDVIECFADILEIHPVGYRKGVEYQGFFLTEKACLAHLAENKHNLPEGTDSYLNHAYRNPELRQLLENVGKLVGVNYEKK